MTAHEQPISYLDSILNEEESRCEYGHQWRNFTISRSGRFKSKNRKRDAVDGRLFDAANAAANMKSTSASASVSASASMSAKSAAHSAVAGHSRVMTSATSATVNPHYKQEPDKNTYRQPTAISSKLFATQSTPSAYASSNSRNAMMRDKTECYKSYYETNL